MAKCENNYWCTQATDLISLSVLCRGYAATPYPDTPPSNSRQTMARSSFDLDIKIMVNVVLGRNVAVQSSLFCYKQQRNYVRTYVLTYMYNDKTCSGQRTHIFYVRVLATHGMTHYETDLSRDLQLTMRERIVCLS